MVKYKDIYTWRYMTLYCYCCSVAQSCLTLCDPMDCMQHVRIPCISPSPVKWSESLSVVSDSLWAHGLYSPWNSPGQNTVVGSLSLLPGIESRSPTLQADSLSAEPQGKPKNSEVGSLSLLQRIFPTQESNRGLLHRRWILYQLSYERSPGIL